MQSIIVSYQFLNHNVIELILKLDSVVTVKPGQWTLLSFDWEVPFKRAYSIAHHEVVDNYSQITLLIKLMEGWKAAAQLREKKVGDTIEVWWVFGHFFLQDTNLPKVFIGTWTGIAPIVCMASVCKAPKKIFFSVSYEKDLFYVDQLKKIWWKDISIHVSREQVAWCETGRIDLTKKTFAPDSEFYLCGNPDMVNAQIETIKAMWFTRIYSEKY